MVIIWFRSLEVDMDPLHTGERRATLVYWPESVDERLDILLALVKSCGEHASRAQILAALVANAPLDGKKLGQLIRAYRERTEEAFANEHAEHQQLSGDRTKPGPRGGR